MPIKSEPSISRRSSQSFKALMTSYYATCSSSPSSCLPILTSLCFSSPRLRAVELSRLWSSALASSFRRSVAIYRLKCGKNSLRLSVSASRRACLRVWWMKLTPTLRFTRTRAPKPRKVTKRASENASAKTRVLSRRACQNVWFSSLLSTLSKTPLILPMKSWALKTANSCWILSGPHTTSPVPSMETSQTASSFRRSTKWLDCSSSVALSRKSTDPLPPCSPSSSTPTSRLRMASQLTTRLASSSFAHQCYKTMSIRSLSYLILRLRSLSLPKESLDLNRGVVSTRVLLRTWTTTRFPWKAKSRPRDRIPLVTSVKSKWAKAFWSSRCRAWRQLFRNKYWTTSSSYLTSICRTMAPLSVPFSLTWLFATTSRFVLRTRLCSLNFSTCWQGLRAIERMLKSFCIYVFHP